MSGEEEGEKETGRKGKQTERGKKEEEDKSYLSFSLQCLMRAFFLFVLILKYISFFFSFLFFKF